MGELNPFNLLLLFSITISVCTKGEHMYGIKYYLRSGKSCGHVAALAFKVEVALRTGLIKIANTSSYAN